MGESTGDGIICDARSGAGAAMEVCDEVEVVRTGGNKEPGPDDVDSFVDVGPTTSIAINPSFPFSRTAVFISCVTVVVDSTPGTS